MSLDGRTPPLPEEEESGGGELMGRRFGVPSSSRPRSADLAWPEHFVEAVAVRVAADVAIERGRLDAAPAVVTLFQVCSAWRAISLSDLLWEQLTSRVWSPRRVRRFPSWQDEFINLHRTATNFRAGRCMHTRVHPSLSRILSCRRLAISDRHLAAGFSDGSLRLYDLPTAALLSQHDLQFHRHRFRLGHFSTSICGIVLLQHKLIFASQDGNICVASITDDNGGFTQTDVRRSRTGNPVEDGTLVDFTGDGQCWVGIFAGVPGSSWRVWDGETERELYAGGSLTDPDSVAGWHMLADISGLPVARIALAEAGLVVGCTSSYVQAIIVNETVGVTAEMELQAGAVAGALAANSGRVMVVNRGCDAVVWDARTWVELCRFRVIGSRRVDEAAAAARGRIDGVGCMNWGFVVIWMGGGGGAVWDTATGRLLYRLRQRVGEIRAAAASDRYVAAWGASSGLHLWDFGAGL